MVPWCRILVLALVLLAATAIRFHGLADQGLFMFDETRYVLEARTLSAHLSWLRSPAPVPDAGPTEGMARPLHVMMIAVAGGAPAAAECMAFLGVASVLLVWLIVRTVEALASPGVASWAPEFAAFLLAFSPSQAFHSRTLLAEIDAIFFLLLAVYLHLDAESRTRLLASGLALGLALVTQSRMTMLIPGLLLWEIIDRRSVTRLANLVAGLLLPVLAVELFYRLLQFRFAAGGRHDYFMTYFQQFLHRAEIDRGFFGFNRPLFALRYMALVESLPVLVLFLGGILVAVRERRRPSLFLAAAALWAVAAASFWDQVHHHGFRWGRAVAPAVPFAAMLAGIALDRLARWRRTGLAAALLLGISITALRAETLLELTRMHSDQGEVLARATRLAPARHFFSEELLLIPYLLGPDSLPPSFIPRTDTLTVVLLDPPQARNFGFFYLLPDTPSFVIAERHHRPSRLHALEGVTRPWFTAVPPVVRPAQVFVLPPAETSAVKVRRIF